MTAKSVEELSDDELEAEYKLHRQEGRHETPFSVSKLESEINERGVQL